MRVKGVPDLYCIGDLARFQYWATGETIRIEHYDVAQQHGRVAAANIIGKKMQYRSVPFFWTTLFGASIRYAGNAHKWDKIVLNADPVEDPKKPPKFIAYFTYRGAVDAVATCNADPIAAAAAELIRVGKMPSADAVAQHPDISLTDLLH
eukprot:TRINITY_DN761_c0_g2_i3.p1 TRINITY_DN761_c0_g2~~TRINITY_DN761_c0_g2_i3.p1  ORF type:complete len:163 (+),score=27.94 TRINITY_DN761_c0_g2_i3:42-491(+)